MDPASVLWVQGQGLLRQETLLPEHGVVLLSPRQEISKQVENFVLIEGLEQISGHDGHS